MALLKQAVSYAPIPAIPGLLHRSSKLPLARLVEVAGKHGRHWGLSGQTPLEPRQWDGGHLCLWVQMSATADIEHVIVPDIEGKIVLN
ncbi:MAG TPA: hypothetical protein VIG90_02350 [Pedomonas sp.]|uniref:hypothetical protein n=1 Tax=Pedomonas sp. TaxID=2976421 RepID=UPI002F3EBE62